MNPPTILTIVMPISLLLGAGAQANERRARPAPERRIASLPFAHCQGGPNADQHCLDDTDCGQCIQQTTTNCADDADCGSVCDGTTDPCMDDCECECLCLDDPGDPCDQCMGGTDCPVTCTPDSCNSGVCLPVGACCEGASCSETFENECTGTWFDGQPCAPAFCTGSIHAFGFEDMDADGNYEPPTDTPWDPALPGKKIDLLDAAGNFITSQETDATGQVWFLDLPPGVYTLQEDLSIWDPNHIMPSPDPDGPGGVPGGADPRTVTVTRGTALVWQDGAAAGMLPPGQAEQLVDDGRLIFGNFIKGSIHAFGFEDMDADGNYEPPTDTPWDPALPGKKIDLLDANGNFITSQETDATGRVWFLGLTPGVYGLQEDLSVFGPDASSNHIMPSPDPDGPGGVPGGGDLRFVTITSGKELVWQDGAAAGMLLPGQEEQLVDDGRLIFGNFIKGSIHAFGFEDMDADGNYEPPTDTPWNVDPGKKIDLFDAAGNFITSQMTDATGQVWFLGLTPGVYMVQEDLIVFDLDGDGSNANDHIMPSPDPDGAEPIPGGGDKRTLILTSGKELVWQDGAAGMLLPGQEEQLVDDGRLIFGNFIKGSIHGYKFDDLNSNGVDDGEPRVPGVTVYLDANDNGVFDGGEHNTPTATNGEYWFTGLLPGVTYRVREVLPAAQSQTTPNPANIDLLSGREYVAIPGQADLLPGQEELLQPDLAFGNTLQLGSIHGHKFKDLNANGVDDDEPRLEGVTITLTGDVDGDGVIETVSMVTSPLGEYWFDPIFPGTYTVTETPPVGWVPSTPTSVDITVDPGVEKVAQAGQAMLTAEEIAAGVVEMVDGRLAFGNFENGSIHALKYKDLNANGVRDPNEPGLAGVDFELTGISGMGDPVGPLVAQSMDDGAVWFVDLKPGIYTLTELIPDGYMTSTHDMADPSVTVTIVSGQEYVALPGQAGLPDPVVPPSMKFETVDQRLLFGNFEKGSIHALKFKDVDVNGIYDPSVDERLAGVEFTLTGIDGMGNAVGPIVMASMVDNGGTPEDETGLLWFTELKPGTYTLTETIPAGYFSSTHDTDDPSVTVTIVSGQEYVALAGLAGLPDPVVPPSMKFETVDDRFLFGNFIPVCGNGILEPGEECDDGNTIDYDLCANDCTINPDSDGDGFPDIYDQCPDNALRVCTEVCGCDYDGPVAADTSDGPQVGFPTIDALCAAFGIDYDRDIDSDGVFDCHDHCPLDTLKTEPGICGCQWPDVDTDGDGTYDCPCPDLPEPCTPGGDDCENGDCVECAPAGSGLSFGATCLPGEFVCVIAGTCGDRCPTDPAKLVPGVCGCHAIPNTDSDGDGVLDCADGCPLDPAKTAAGVCGCGFADSADGDDDGVLDCVDGCPDDPAKLSPGLCGCGEMETPPGGYTIGGIVHVPNNVLDGIPYVVVQLTCEGLDPLYDPIQLTSTCADVDHTGLFTFDGVPCGTCYLSFRYQDTCGDLFDVVACGQSTTVGAGEWVTVDLSPQTAGGPAPCLQSIAVAATNDSYDLLMSNAACRAQAGTPCFDEVGYPGGLVASLPRLAGCFFEGACCGPREAEALTPVSNCLCSYDCNNDGIFSIVSDLWCWARCLVTGACHPEACGDEPFPPGYVPQGFAGHTVGGIVYVHADDPLLSGAEGIQVDVIDRDGMIYPTTTNRLGVWVIDGLEDGRYVVEFDGAASARVIDVRADTLEENQSLRWLLGARGRGPEERFRSSD